MECKAPIREGSLSLKTGLFQDKEKFFKMLVFFPFLLKMYK